MITSDIKVLFVCLGNICRSPSAQAVFEAQICKAGLQKYIFVDSCGTEGYHIGEAPDPRSVSAAEMRGYQMAHLRGRKLALEDFVIFDYILAMDNQNLSNILRISPENASCHISLFLEFDSRVRSSGKTLEVPDPYYGGTKGFEKVLDLIESAGEGLLAHIKQKHF